jgi:hypothetical protein
MQTAEATDFVPSSPSAGGVPSSVEVALSAFPTTATEEGCNEKEETESATGDDFTSRSYGSDSSAEEEFIVSAAGAAVSAWSSAEDGVHVAFDESNNHIEVGGNGQSSHGEASRDSLNPRYTHAQS